MAILSTIPTIELETEGAKNKENIDEEDQGLDVNDDFKREMHLYVNCIMLHNYEYHLVSDFTNIVRFCSCQCLSYSSSLSPTSHS